MIASSAAFADHAKGADLFTDRRHRSGTDDLVARKDRRQPQLGSGYFEEASAWRDWLVRAVAGNPDQFQIMYGLAGERRLRQWEVPWLRGFGNSKPVRVGNAAHDVLQLDVFGELMDALYQARRGGLPTSEPTWDIERALLNTWLQSGNSPTPAFGKFEALPSFHLFEDDGVGCVRPGHQELAGIRLSESR